MEDLEQVVRAMLKSVSFSRAPMRKTLFNLLWQNQPQKTRGREILKELWPDAEENQYLKYRTLIRQQCSALSQALDDYFNKGGQGWNTTSPWVIGLKEGGPERGYSMDCRKRNDPASLTRAFWQPHLDSGQPISLIHVEQRFFLDEPEGLVFRYYNCNEEHNASALAELKLLHPTHPNVGKVIPLHPYVARGEIAARDMVTKWFRDAAFELVESAASRNISDNAPAWTHSLILFGSAASNRFVGKILRRYAALPIQRVSRTSFTVKTLGGERTVKDELARLDGAQAEGHCVVKTSGQDLVFDFDPKTKIAPVVITRVPNPDGTHAAVTIFDSERGKTVEQTMAVLTDDSLLRPVLQQCDMEARFPAAFQILCAASMRSHEREIFPLAWRAVETSVLASLAGRTR